MGIKRWLHAKVRGHLFFLCICDVCRYDWSVFGDVARALRDLHRHRIDYHGGVDLSD